ncbi:MAG: hypothetical protein SYC29_15005 [Planctomycetota bacterium]|nr:hypothetical protein [Planctomycetota bacterium]
MIQSHLNTAVTSSLQLEAIIPVAASPHLSTSGIVTGVSTMLSECLDVKIVTCVVPLLLAPIIAFALRPIFALFARQGAQLFCALDMSASLAEALGHYVAIFDAVTLATASSGVVACVIWGAPWPVTIAVVAGGVLIALFVTVSVVRVIPGIEGRTALAVGLLTFAGGNLPLFLAAALTCVVL